MCGQVLDLCIESTGQDEVSARTPRLEWSEGNVSEGEEYKVVG
jgi:hypothetical protein